MSQGLSDAAISPVCNRTFIPVFPFLKIGVNMRGRTNAKFFLAKNGKEKLFPTHRGLTI